jgi:hypothetical protein
VTRRPFVVVNDPPAYTSRRDGERLDVPPVGSGPREQPAVVRENAAAPMRIEPRDVDRRRKPAA